MDQQLRIERLGHLGDGVADGPVFVARTLPGEVVEGAVEGDRIAKPRIVEPSADRVVAPCRHYKSCGGCSLQHASNDFVSGWKVQIVRDALAAHGLEAPIRRLHTSPSASRRRATFTGRRLKSGPLIGFHGRATHDLVAVPDCHLLHPDLIRAMTACADLATLLGSRKGELRFQVTVTEAGADIAVSGGRTPERDDWNALATLAETHGLARLTIGEHSLQRHPPLISLDGIKVTLTVGAFLQATEAGEAALRASVVDALADAGTVVDLFSGLGTFTLPLARRAEVHGVEGEGDLLTALDHGWRNATGLKKVTTERRDLFRNPLIKDELMRFDAAVIDPPRAGAEAQTQTLITAQIPRIAAVSCNPATFARDAKILTDGGYALEWIDVVDQFRWSHHVELAAAFVRRT